MVSPSSSRSMRDRTPTCSRRICSSTEPRMASCSITIDENSGCRSAIDRLVVGVRQQTQLRRLVLRQRVAQEIPATNLGTGEVLEQVRLAKRRMTLDVK